MQKLEEAVAQGIHRRASWGEGYFVQGVAGGSKPRKELGVEDGPAEIVYLERARLEGCPWVQMCGN